MSVLADQDIVRLQISVDYTVRVKILQRQYKFTSVHAGNFLGKAPLSLKILAKIATWAILEEQKHVLTVLECEVEFDQEIVLREVGQDIALRLRVLGQLLLEDGCLVDDFHGERHLFLTAGECPVHTRIGQLDKVDVAEGTLSQLDFDLEIGQLILLLHLNESLRLTHGLV